MASRCTNRMAVVSAQNLRRLNNPCTLVRLEPCPNEMRSNSENLSLPSWLSLRNIRSFERHQGKVKGTLHSGADLRQKASSATLPERPSPPLLLLPLPSSPSPPFSSLPSPLTPPVFPPLPSLRSRPLKSSWAVWGSVVSSPSAEIEFDAFYP